MEGKKASTREKIAAAGADILSRRGIEEITIGTLAEETGMSKSGLFAHFGSKENLQIALLEETSKLFVAAVIQPILAREPGLPRVIGLFDLWFGWTEIAGLGGGCPVAAAMFELDDRPSAIRDIVATVEVEWRATMAGWVRESVEQGHFRTNLDCEQFVWELCGIYLCHHVSHRFARDPGARDRARTAFNALVERSLKVVAA